MNEGIAAARSPHNTILSGGVKTGHQMATVARADIGESAPRQTYNKYQISAS